MLKQLSLTIDAYILLVNLGSVVGWLLLESIVRARNIFARVLVRTLQTEHTTDVTGFFWSLFRHVPPTYQR